jgi:hypothetical protein
MSITMKLDAPAVRSLIKDDASFELELQAAVINEIVRGLYDKSIPTALRQMIETACADRKQSIVDAVHADVGFRAHVDSVMSAMVQSVRASTSGYTAQRTLSDDVRRMINNHISSLVEEEVRKREEGLTASVDSMITRLERRFEADIERRVAEINRAYHNVIHRRVMERVAEFAAVTEAEG